jgi:hypothetical protein
VKINEAASGRPVLSLYLHGGTSFEIRMPVAKLIRINAANGIGAHFERAVRASTDHAKETLRATRCQRE